VLPLETINVLLSVLTVWKELSLACKEFVLYHSRSSWCSFAPPYACTRKGLPLLKEIRVFGLPVIYGKNSSIYIELLLSVLPVHELLFWLYTSTCFPGAPILKTSLFFLLKIHKNTATLSQKPTKY
jgi:hypothetical protein